MNMRFQDGLLFTSIQISFRGRFLRWWEWHGEVSIITREKIIGIINGLILSACYYPLLWSVGYSEFDSIVVLLVLGISLIVGTILFFFNSRNKTSNEAVHGALETFGSFFVTASIVWIIILYLVFKFGDTYLTWSDLVITLWLIMSLVYSLVIILGFLLVLGLITIKKSLRNR